jgi:pimeloyl-ACP methyl ester carboxylesterase
VPAAAGAYPAYVPSVPEVPGVRHESLELSTGVRLHVAQAGDPDAPPLLLLHGWPQHWYLWRDVIPRLSDSFRLICPDNRGFGWSEDPPDGDFRKRRIADDALALLDALGIERAGLIGHDWGGFAGWFACLDAPQRIRGFLCLNVIHPWQPTERTLLNAWRLSYQLPLAAPLVGHWLAGDGRLLEALLRRSMDAATAQIFVAQLRPESSVQLYRQFLLRDAPALAGAVDGRRIEVPVRVLFGRHDPVQGTGQLDGLDEHAPDSEVEVVDAGHFIVDERPELVADRARSLFVP